MFRQAMNSPSVRLEVLPVANKPRYEKSLIGQLFTGDSKDSATVKAKSPMVVRAKTDPQPEPRLDTRVETRPAKTPEPTLVNTVELQPRPNSQERASPAPVARTESTSPTPRPTRSQSPLASKNQALPGLASLTTRKGGKRVKIDLKKGKCEAERSISEDISASSGLVSLLRLPNVCKNKLFPASRPEIWSL